VRQERVLLALVEAVHLVDEDDRAPALRPRRLGALDGIANVLYAAEDGRHGDELGIEGIGHEARQRRLADAGRTPEDHRMQAPRFEGDTQRPARAEQMLLADDLVERLRAQPLGERRRDVSEGKFERRSRHVGSTAQAADVAPILPWPPAARRAGDIRCAIAHLGRCAPAA